MSQTVPPLRKVVLSFSSTGRIGSSCCIWSLKKIEPPLQSVIAQRRQRGPLCNAMVIAVERGAAKPGMKQHQVLLLDLRVEVCRDEIEVHHAHVCSLPETRQQHAPCDEDR